jgi:mRNA interferase HigB
MVIISKGIIHEFALKHPRSVTSLNSWHLKTKKGNWNNLAEIKGDFNSADPIGNDRYVFNISGNHFRLIAMIHFGIRILYIRGIFTHQEYDYLNKTGRTSTL